MSSNQQQQQQSSPGISSNSSSISNSSISGSSNHWSQKKHESVLDLSKLSQIDLEKLLLIKLQGGSENGQFVYLNPDFDSTYLNFTTNSKLIPNEIILEIQSNKVSGYTLFDCIDLLNKLYKSNKTITFRSVKSISLNSQYDLRSYLDARFHKGSIDYDLQQTIRENVYMRTVPCTTRLPRNGEINGQDYIFLNDEQFLELEQNGDLLEYGVYNGHYYGTPKPPKRNILLLSSCNSQTQSPQILNDFNNPKRNQSMINSNLTDNDYNRVLQQQATQQADNIEQSLDFNDSEQVEQEYCGDQESEQDQLDQQQQQQQVNSNVKQLINTNSLNRNNKFNGLDTNTSLESGVEVIPYGWEKVEDPEYGTFYIDHINKQTTYENPFMIQQQQQKMKTFKPNQPLEKPQKQQRNVFFTQDPNELKGEFIRTSLLKTNNGFGFTIIGANETSEDFLQIKYIVPDGAAARDAKLRQGDVLVYVNNECVLGYTHQDVVEIFQSIPKGNFVDLTVCRGYPLSIDPNDPNIEIMSLPAINPEIQAPLAAVDEMTASTLMNSSNHNLNQQVKQIPVEIEPEQTQTDQYYCEEYDEMYAPIVKGPKGFGFTIADDSVMNHQKVKQILDRERCVNLQENDILLEINGIDLKNLNHNQVVDVLKDCIKGQETIIRLKRRKYQITLPQVPSNSSLGNQQDEKMMKYRVTPDSSEKNDEFLFYSSSSGTETSSVTSSSSSTKSMSKLKNKKSKKLNGTTKEQFEYNSTTKIENFEEYKEFRSINSTLKQANGLLFNGPIQQQQPTNSQSFNYERRSKTPNILQSSSSNTNLQSNIKPMGSGVNPPQLRSKTPTTDRVLFQHTLNESPNKTPNDYIYLNGQVNGKSVNDLYSTVNRKQFDQVDEKHIPIYDSTTNLQHQRVQQNLNKFQQIQNNQKISINPLVTNRSKTPGPEMIYFRNNTSNENFNPYSNYGVQSKIVSPTMNTFANRSKTPTADMMYYPPKPSIHQPIRQSYFMEENENEFVEHTNDDLINLFKRMDKNSLNITNDVDGNYYIEMMIELLRQDSGFGFRIIGGEEEGSQVAVGYIVQSGAAHLDNRLRPNDEIIMIDNECVLGSTHRRVVQLMTIAGLNRRVKLMIRRKINQQQYQMLINLQQQRNRQTPSSMLINNNSPVSQKYPFTITLFRNGNEGFGFVIISTLNKNGPSIGKIVENSPAERCKRLNVGDRILAVNGINITQMNHIDIVKLIKESGNSITLTIGSPENQTFFAETKPLPPTEPILNSLGSMKIDQNFTNSQFITSPGPIRPTKAIINQNEFHVIELRKHQAAGFGFSIRGGKEFNIPLFVLKLADYGPAALDGRLQVGDQILEINGHEAFSMTHSEAIELIKAGGNAVNLVIRRTGMPPPSITDIIAANSTATIASAQQQTQPQMVPSLSSNNLTSDLNTTNHQLRSKSPYLNQSYQVQQQQMQHQVKHFNSSGTLMNRNF